MSSNFNFQMVFLVALMAIKVHCASCETYHFAPNGSHPLCEQCVTLDQLGNVSSLKNDTNVVLVFLPGEHSLANRVKFKNLLNITLTSGEIESDSTLIKCESSGGFSFSDVHILQIVNMTFTSAGPTLLSVDRAITVVIQDCQMSGIEPNYRMANSLLVIANVEALSIVDTVFHNANYTYRDGVSYGGALTVANASNVSIAQSVFADNHIRCRNCPVNGGGASLRNISQLTLVNCSFTHNQLDCYHCTNEMVTGGAAAFIVDTNQVMIINSMFKLNKAEVNNGKSYGASVYADVDSIAIVNSSFVNNEASPFNQCGGALFIKGGNFTSAYCIYKNNLCGAVQFYGQSMGIFDSEFAQNQVSVLITGSSVWANTVVAVMARSSFASNSGGGVHIILHENGEYQSLSNSFVSNIDGSAEQIDCGENCSSRHELSYYEKNHANEGGAINVCCPQTTIMDTVFIDNIADEHGGAAYMHDGDKGSIINSTYHRNRAKYGGALGIFKNDQFTMVSGNKFSNNSARYGGALWVSKSNFSGLSNQYINNQADNGGGMYVTTGDIVIDKEAIAGNRAWKKGAAIYHEIGRIIMRASVISGNICDNNGVIYINTATAVYENSIFSDNRGSFLAINSNLSLTGHSIFIHNHHQAIVSIQGSVSVNSTALVNITSNKSLFGGGLYISESCLVVKGHLYIADNFAEQSGGGVHAYQSRIMLKGGAEHFSLHNNSAQDGGAMCLVASNLKIFSGIVNFSANKAGYGGALSLKQNSKIQLFRALSDSKGQQSKVEFCSNFASFGGAIHVADRTSDHELCSQDNAGKRTQFVSEVECFIQALNLLDPSKTTHCRSAPLVFHSNSALENHGNDVFGGLLDRCTPSPFAEQCWIHPNGLNYFKAFSVFNNQRGNDISKGDLQNHITSEAVQLCFCLNDTSTVYDCSAMHKQVYVQRGKEFLVNITAVDHIENPVHSSILAKFSANSSVGHFKENQTEIEIDDVCTTLVYNVYSADSSVSIDLYADGPCMAEGISKRQLNVTFIDCSCPIRFSQSDSPTECICECDVELKEYLSSKYPCNAERRTVQLSTSKWIMYINGTTPSSYNFLTFDCLFDYCSERPVNVTFYESRMSDEQCAFNRSNRLCGECKTGLSMVLGSSNCKVCSNAWLLLTLVFTVQGILLVVLILLVDMTVATGAINGLLFYCNIVSTSVSVLVSGEGAKIVLKIFISWLNLDWGIETCFYSGMDALDKVFLQVAFPCYLILLIAVIIIISDCSKRFAAFLGSKNPVATLCTLILLIYTKLVQMVTAALHWKAITYPNDTTQVVWLYDANVDYLKGKHIGLFIIALIVIGLGIVLTVLLFFGQWLPRLPNRTVTKWIRHPKYNAFIDAFHAPFVPRHRYWVGLLLLARIVHILVRALCDDNATLLSMVCISLALLMLKTLCKKVYKYWILDIVENVFLINLMLLSLSLYYLNFRDAGDHQSAFTALVSTSISIALVIFIALLCYYVYSSLRLSLFKKVYQIFTENLTLHHQPYQQVAKEETDENQQSSDDYKSVEKTLDEPLNLDQFREPDLNELDPITPDHYRNNKESIITTKRQVTQTVIDKPN